MSEAPARAQIGIIGLATMGRSLALNFADHGVRVAVWNLEPELTQAFMDTAPAGAVGVSSLRELVDRLASPRCLMMMIKAGDAVDEVLAQLTPLLEPGDIVIDGGNTLFRETRRRAAALAAQDIDFVGLGVSGGEAGARYGPSMMFGGSERAWRRLQPILSPIAASKDGRICVERMGADGAGHYVKMVHNGIEYGEMQLIAEVYHLLRDAGGRTAPAIADTFAQWQRGPLQSFLVELTARVLGHADPASGRPLVDLILDAAGQKGTGRWTAQLALELGVAVPTIAAAVDARIVSSAWRQRREVAASLAPPARSPIPDDVENLLHDALYAARIANWAQGFQLIRAGSDAFGWQIPPAAPARVWTAGCIIRAAMLDDIIRVQEKVQEGDDAPGNLILAPHFSSTLDRVLPALREMVAWGARSGIPLPAFSASLAWIDGWRSARLPHNLIQAQRDAFGAHTYHRLDDPEGDAVHTEWP